MAIMVRHHLHHRGIVEVLSRIDRTLQRTHSCAALDKRLHEVLQQIRLQGDLVSLEIHKVVPIEHACHPSHSIGACPIVSGDHHGTTAESFHGLLDPLVVGGDQHIRHHATGRRLFIHILDHGLPSEHDERLSWKARRPIPGRDDYYDGWWGLSHGQEPLIAAVPIRWRYRPCRRRYQRHSSPTSPQLLSRHRSTARGPTSQPPYRPHR